MIRRLGNFFFRYRNLLFPFFFAVLAFGTKPAAGSEAHETLRYLAGFGIALSGQILRALTIGLAYIVRGGRDRKVYAKDLVVEGIFSHSRNPLYLGNILIVIGLAVVTNSPYFYLFGIPAFLFIYYAIVVAEEAFLSEKFGEAYQKYCRNVNRFIPGLAGLSDTIRGMSFKWQRLIVKEYGTTYTWTAGLVLLMMKNRYLQYGPDASRGFIVMLSGILLGLTLLWATARFLKKKRILSERS
jgi:protein-S-isoprenylcysteine O-methyltransferase Ste14